MDVQVDGNLIRCEREKRAWSQEHLAGAAGIGARTIQRIEATGVASYESVRAISAALEIPVSELRAGGIPPMPSPVDAEAVSADHVTVPKMLPPSSRLRLAARCLGAAVALALLAGTTGFFLLHDYQKVRVLRAVEQWVTSGEPAAVASRSDSRQ